jgi:hypothetical protein
MPLINRIVPFFFLAVLCSCETKDDVQSDIDKLRQKRASYEKNVGVLEAYKYATELQIKRLEEELKEKKIYQSGRVPKYVLTLELSQSHFTLDLGTHLKDSMNTCEFEIPVDKELYEKLNVGDSLVDEFRVGSLIMNGSFGDWNVEVINKEIK